MTLGKAIGRALVWSLCFAILVLPFVGGFPLAYVAMLLSVLSILWWLCNRPRWRELGDAGGLMTLGAFVLIAIAFAFSAKQPGDMIFCLNFALLALYPLIRASVSRFAAPRNSLWVGLLALAGVTVAAGVALFQFEQGAARPGGYMSDPIWAAQTAVIMGFTALIGLDATRSRWRFGLLLGPVLALLAVLLTQSRGPLLAIPLLLVGAWVFAPRNRWPMIAAAVAGVVAIALVWFAIPGAAARVGSITDLLLRGGGGDQSIATRVALYRGGFGAMLDSPAIGYGWSQIVAATYAHVPGGRAAIEAADATMLGDVHLHSDILDLGVGAGALGLLAYVLTVLAPLVSALRSPRDAQFVGRLRGSVLLGAALFGCGLSYIMLGYELPTTMFVCIGAIVTGLCRDVPAA